MYQFLIIAYLFTLENENNILEGEVNQEIRNIEEEKIHNLLENIEQLKDIKKNKIDGVMLRSKCRYQDLGVKPTNYLQNRNYTSKIINKLVEDGNEYTNTKDILNCQKEFNSNLYKENEYVNDEDIEQNMGENTIKLTDDEADELEGEITYRELGEALKNMKNGKSPGQDGLTVKFLSFLE